MTTLFTSDRFLDHDTGRHPEHAGRLRSIVAKLHKDRLIERCETGELRSATRHELARIHGGDYIDSVHKFAEKGGGRIESDTVVSPKSYEVALLAAGTALQAVDVVLTKKDSNALVLARPPGHHALASGAMGFCLFNNAALAAQHAIAAHGLSRVLIVDWDVHHGNGTQDIFYEREDVYFFSAHRHPFYPGTGLKNETGTGRGLGTKFNLPVAMGTSRTNYHAQFETMLNDAVKKCRPELIILSAGFDAHAKDPIGSLGLETEDFEKLTRLVQQAAQSHCQGRLVSLLEGGYNVDALADCVALHLSTLLTPID